MPKGDGKIRRIIEKQFPKMSEKEVEEIEAACYEFVELIVAAYQNAKRTGSWKRRRDLDSAQRK